MEVTMEVTVTPCLLQNHAVENEEATEVIQMSSKFEHIWTLYIQYILYGQVRTTSTHAGFYLYLMVSALHNYSNFLPMVNAQDASFSGCYTWDGLHLKGYITEKQYRLAQKES